MRNIIHTFILLLSATAVLSCSAAFDIESSYDAGYPLEISGTVTDADTGAPLEEIRINVQAIHQETVLHTKTVYTGDNGKFTVFLAFDNFEDPTIFVATAGDKDGKYRTGRHEMIISRNAVYNIDKGVFYISCDFHLQKAE